MENEEVKQKSKKSVSVTFMLDAEGQTHHKFRPAIDVEHFKYHYKNLMDNFVVAYTELFDNVGVLRPATTEEKDKHIYVFKSDDKDDSEHKLYKARKMLYEDTLKAFHYILQMVFPDIEYIEDCNQYQQEYVFAEDRTQDEVESYKYDVEYITQQVRENYDKLIDMLNANMAEAMKKQSERNTTKDTTEQNSEEFKPVDSGIIKEA